MHHYDRNIQSLPKKYQASFHYRFVNFDSICQYKIWDKEVFELQLKMYDKFLAKILKLQP